MTIYEQIKDKVWQYTMYMNACSDSAGHKKGYKSTTLLHHRKGHVFSVRLLYFKNNHFLFMKI